MLYKAKFSPSVNTWGSPNAANGLDVISLVKFRALKKPLKTVIFVSTVAYV